MATPTIREVKSRSIDLGSTNHWLDYPADIIDGDILVGVIACYEVSSTAFNFTWDDLDGWAKITTDTESNNTGLSVAVRPAATSDANGATLITTDVSCSHAGFVVSIRDADASIIEAAMAALNETIAPNPPSITPTGGAKDYLFLSFCGYGHEHQTNTLSGYPTNYNLSQLQHQPGTNAWNAAIGMAGRALNATSEDPGAFTLSGASDAVAATIAVHPIESAAVTKTYSVGFSLECQSANFAAGIDFVKNGTESASSIIAVSLITTSTIGTETHAAAYDVIFDSGPVVDGVDTCTYSYDKAAGDITETGSSLPLESITATAVTEICA